MDRSTLATDDSVWRENYRIRNDAERYCNTVCSALDWRTVARTEIPDLLRCATNAEAELIEIRENLAWYPEAIFVREGGGPENLAASMAVTIAKIKDAKDKEIARLTRQIQDVRATCTIVGKGALGKEILRLTQAPKEVIQIEDATK